MKSLKSLRLLWSVIRRIGFHKVLAGFAGWFFISAFLIMLAEPGITRYGDAVWYSFVACTSIGFGDLVAATFAGRLLTILLTIYEIVIVAMFSGVVVSYYLEVVHRRENEMLVNFLDKMEHLTELSQDELREVQDKVKEFRK